MDSLKRKTFETSRALTYTYYLHTGSNNKPTIVLQHGFPDDAHLWESIIAYLIPEGFSLLIPDLLGYGGTSKPLDTSLYSSKAMADDLIEICDAESVKSIISLGHDWGSFMAQRLYLWQPDRVVGLILLNVAYLPPDQRNRFDLQAALHMQEQMTGNPLYAYWELFTASDAAELIEKRLESFFTVLHGDEPNWMKQMFCRRGAMREYLEADRRVPVKQYAQNAALKDKFTSRMKRDGLAAPLQWYKATANNIQFEAEMEIPAHTLVIKKPVLYIGCTGDAVCLSSSIQLPIEKGLLPNVTIKKIECAHWSPMEKPDETGSLIAAFLNETTF